MLNNLTFGPTFGPIGIGCSVSGQVAGPIPSFNDGVCTVQVASSREEAWFAPGLDEASVPADSAESDEYKISLEDGLLIDSLVISNKGSYSATVRKADAYFGTTFDPVPLGDAKYGLRVERVE